MAGTSTTASQTPLTQPAFAPQLSATRDQAMGLTPNLQKGYMIWDVAGGNLGYTGGPYGGRCTFNFMYNPQSIAANFSIENTSTQASMLFNAPGASSVIAVPLSQGVTWTLYFDRTYEVNYNKPNNTPNDPAVIGVHADVIQMMQFTGMLSNMSSGASTTSKTPLANKGGMMVNIFSWVYFGQNVNQQGHAPNNNVAAENRLGYYGFVSGWDVNYTAFTQNMVPYRCQMDVTFQLLPSASSSALTNSALAQGILDPYGNLKNYTSLLSTTKAP